MIERYTYGSDAGDSREKGHPAVTTFLLLGILIYALVVSVLTLDYNSVFIDEAFHITMGKQLLGGEPCDGCPSHTGSVTTWPIMAAHGDSWGGLYGARALTIALGLATTLAIYLTARMLLGPGFAILAAAIFQFSGQALYLMKLATYDMLAALFLSLALLLFVASERVGSRPYEAVALASSAFFIFLAAVTKYLIPVFVPAFLILVLARRGAKKTVLYFLLPLIVISALYIAFAPYPPNGIVADQISGVRETSRLPISTLTDWTFRWVALAYMLWGPWKEFDWCQSIVIIIVILIVFAVIMAPVWIGWGKRKGSVKFEVELDDVAEEISESLEDAIEDAYKKRDRDDD